MKLLVGALALAVSLPVGPAGAQYIPNDWDLIRHAPTFLPESQVPLPALFPQRIVAIGERALGRPAAFNPTVSYEGRFTHHNYQWEDGDISASRIVVTKRTAQAYIRSFGASRKRAGVTVIGQGRYARAMIVLGRHTLAQGYGPRKRAISAARVIAQRTDWVPGALKRHVRRHATEFAAWTLVTTFNVLPSYAGGSEMPDLPADPRDLFVFGNTLFEPLRYLSFGYGSPGCLDLQPARGSRSPVLHVTFDAAVGGHSRVLAVAPGRCTGTSLSP